MLVDAPFNAVTRQIIGAAIEVHRALGPGLLESVYAPCLRHELTARNLRFVTQVELPVIYKGIVVGANYRLDFVVEDVVVIEIKSVMALLPVHEAQLLTYLTLSGKPVGLLVNFNVARLVSGVKRMINPHPVP